MRGGVILKVVLAALIGASLAVAPAAASAAIYTVTGTADSPGPCAGTICPSLRDAISVANGDPGSTIKLGPAQYSLGGGPGVQIGNGNLRITADTTIVGAGSSATSITQTDGLNGVFLVVAGTVTFSGLRITGGHDTGPAGSPGTPSGGAGHEAGGGGIINHGDLTLLDVVVSGNTVTGGAGGGGTAPGSTGGAGGAALGGGVFTSGPLTMVGSSVSGNSAVGGAGGMATNAAAGPGGNADGGLYIDSSSPGDTTIRDSTISNNVATGGAGGVAIGGTPGSGGDASGGVSQWSQTLTLQDSTVSGNSATGGDGGAGFTGANGSGAGDAVGGGLALVSGSLHVERSTISGNRAVGGAGGAADATTGGAGGTGFGGGLYVQGDARVVNATVTSNSAQRGAGGAPIGGSGNPGSNGQAFGGGIDDSAGPTTTLRLASLTLATNAAQTGGNLWAGATRVVVSDTIIHDGTAATGPNCVLTSLTDDGNNLDSATPTQCRFSAGAHDLIGVDPALGALGAHGGPTSTMPLSATSPARGAGGACTDPANGAQPLTVDQRGLPRPVPCDIGAFQTEPPANTSPPRMTGSAVLGGTLACGGAAWSGDGPLSFGVQWLRDGAPIAAASAVTYRAASRDLRHRLSCRVVATGVYGQASATSGAVLVTAPPFGGSSLASTRLKLDKHGNVVIVVACSTAAPGGSCLDAAALYTSAGKLPATISRRARTRRATSFGKARFSLRAGTRKREQIHLIRAGLRLVPRSKSVSLRLILASRDAFGDQQTRVYRVTVSR